AHEIDDLLHSIWLYARWRYVTSQLTSTQKELFADSVDACASASGHGGVADRWWRLERGRKRATERVDRPADERAGETPTEYVALEVAQIEQLEAALDADADVLRGVVAHVVAAARTER